MIAESIAHYRIIKKLGAGGMGEVYLAQDTKLDRKVAIKVLQPDSLADENLKKRLLREAQAAAKLDHPNICAIYDVNEADSFTFIVMQYIEGESLAEMMERKPIGLTTVLALAEQAAEGLAEAHEHGIVHRDIKPQNIMIGPRGQLKILDFGLAKMRSESVDHEAATATLLSRPGHVIGTMPYMSPEQVQGEPLDASSDVFSLGVTLYEVLAGKHPFKDKSSAATMSRILRDDPIPTEQFQAQVSPELETLLRKMLSKDKTARYQSAQELLTDLRQLPAQVAAHDTRPNDPRTKEVKAVTTTEKVADSVLSKAQRFKWALLASALALILLAFAISRWQATEPSDSLAILPFTYA